MVGKPRPSTAALRVGQTFRGRHERAREIVTA
jgi:hypothetical protein